MKFKNRTAEQIMRRYWLGHHLIRVIRWVACIFCMAILFRCILFNDNPLWILLIFAVYLLFLQALRLGNSLWFLTLNQILNRHCDPVKFSEVSQLLQQKIGSNTSGMAALNVAWGLYWSGRFGEAEKALTNVDLKRKNSPGQLLLWNLDFNCRVQRGDLDGARYVRQEVEASIQKKKPGSAVRKAGERLLDIMDAAFAERTEDWETFRRLHDHLAMENTTEFRRVTAAFSLAKADLAQGEAENARTRLAYVAEHGGTLYIAEEARRLLA